MSTSDTKNPYRRDYQILKSIWQDQKQEGEEVFLTQRLAQTVVCIWLFVSPATLVRFLGSKAADRKGRKIAIELYVLFKVALVVSLLFFGTAGKASAIIAAVSLADLCINLSGFILLRKHWKPSASVTRSIILLGFNFVELCSTFGIFYLVTKSVQNADRVIVTDPASIFYFSVITSATVGYGDMTPATVIGRWIVVLQVTLSLAFVGVVLATFVSKLSPDTKPQPSNE